MIFLIPFSIIFLILSAITVYNLKEKLWEFTLCSILITTTVLSVVFLKQSEINTVFLPLFSEFGIGFSINSLGLLFCMVACILWIVSIIESKEYFSHHAEKLNRYFSALLMTFAGCIGVFLANDLFTLFVFFELMSFASYIWVSQNQDLKSISASNSYLSFATIGGLVMLFGIFILNSLAGNLVIADLSTTFSNFSSETMLYVACAMLLFGFGAKAGLFLLHDWLALAHTASPAPASGLLSGLLTKTGVFGIIIITLKIVPFSITWAWILLVFSLFNMLFGAVFAFMSNDVKRTLAFSSVSQIGFILWGVALSSILGEHNTFAVYGTVFHMINHSFIKIILFSLVGVMYQNIHSLNLNDLQGFGKNKLWLKICFAIGGLSIMGIPLFSGYISKTLLHESIVEYMHLHHVTGIYTVFEYLFLLAGGFTFAYILKIFICIFVKNPIKAQTEEKYVTMKTKIAISFVCSILVLLGLTANFSFAMIGEYVSGFFGAHALHENIDYFSWTNLKGSLISISIGLVLYFIVAQKTVITKDKGYIEAVNPKITIENLIYKPMLRLLALVFGFIVRLFDISLDLIVFLINRIGYKSVQIPETFFEGKKRQGENVSKVSITHTLAYSLLLFGIGFIVTVSYLLFT